MEKPKAMIHAAEGGVPTMVGTPRELIHLLSALLCEILRGDLSQWDYAHDEIFAAFQQNESTGRTILRWVNYIAKGIIVGLAMYGAVCLGMMMAR